MRGLDNDGDGIITEAEFSALPEGQVDEQWEKADKVKKLYCDIESLFECLIH